MKLIVVGCSSGMPSATLSHSCYLIEDSGRLCMFDCGEGASSALLRCRIDTSSIGNIFISHTHADHVGGLPILIQMEYLKNRTEPLTIHVPSEFEKAFRVMLRHFYLFPEKLNFDLEVKPVDGGVIFDDGNMTVDSHANSHLQSPVIHEHINSKSYDNRMQCFSFTALYGDRKIAYSADIGCLEDLKNIAADADLLLTEGMHLDLGELPALLIEENVKRCILTHLPDSFDREATKLAFAKSGYADLGFAHEGQVVNV